MHLDHSHAHARPGQDMEELPDAGLTLAKGTL